MKKIIFFCLLALVQFCTAQNIGIGTTNPSAYGHGGNNRLLEINNPAVGGDVQSHLILSSGGTGGSLGGITWAGTSLASGEKRTGYIGNLLEGVSGSKLTFYNKNTSGSLVERLTLNSLGYLGIGINNPNTALTFASTLGRKINLYTGSLGNVGMGVYANEFRIHSDYPNADITFGYENTAGVFTERMRVRGSGAVSFNGNAGSPGQVLVNNGAGLPQWSSGLPKTYHTTLPADFYWGANTGGAINLPGFSITVILPATSRVNVSVQVNYAISNCFACGNLGRGITLKRNSGNVRGAAYYGPQDDSEFQISNFSELLPPGTYTYTVDASRVFQSYDIMYRGGNTIYNSYMTIQVFPE
ncbi:MAG: hypothetical protein H7Y86_21385 [Rhizobacter sp.]|nr:hypothetical protein [Ferruginibacter sp.]